MRLLLALCLALLTVTPSVAQTTPTDPYMACLHEQSAALDDNKSDARTIAVAIVTSCWSHRGQYGAAPELSEYNSAIVVVLQERRKAR